ncbi:MAG: hypothetical protein M1834_004238 [Cirrosporium novae-zelandiae]|nr:MAG: hypothetical protein M1834_004238 [Cirrosporium novae-zelandiae]
MEESPKISTVKQVVTAENASAAAAELRKYLPGMNLNTDQSAMALFPDYLPRPNTELVVEQIFQESSNQGWMKEFFGESFRISNIKRFQRIIYTRRPQNDNVEVKSTQNEFSRWMLVALTPMNEENGMPILQSISRLSPGEAVGLSGGKSLKYRSASTGGGIGLMLVF